jgi:serine/threonine protein kinase
MDGFDLNDFTKHITKGAKDEKGNLIYKKYIYNKLLGKGTYGEVYLCKEKFAENKINGRYELKLSEKYYAIKIFTDKEKEERELDYERELKALKKISDNKICQEYLLCMIDYGKTSSKTNPEYCIVFEYLENYVSLHDFLDNIIKPQYLQITDKIFEYPGILSTFIHKLATGLKTLHDNNMSHFDLNNSNIMVKYDKYSNDIRVKYIDYGMAMHCDENHTHSETDGTYMFIDAYSLNPEYRKNGKFSNLVCYKSDLYSLGMIIMEMIHKIKNNSPMYTDKDEKYLSIEYIVTQNELRRITIKHYLNTYRKLFKNNEYDITSIFSRNPNERKIELFDNKVTPVQTPVQVDTHKSLEKEEDSGEYQPKYGLKKEGFMDASNYKFSEDVWNEWRKFIDANPNYSREELIKAFAEELWIWFYVYQKNRDNETINPNGDETRKNLEKKFEKAKETFISNDKDKYDFEKTQLNSNFSKFTIFKNILKEKGKMTGGKQIPPYTIRRYTYGKARKLGVRVRPSTKKDKKLDVFRHNKKIASIGARGMGDYPTFRQTRGQTFANRRRRAYKIRHQRDRTKRWSRGWLADQLLW